MASAVVTKRSSAPSLRGASLDPGRNDQGTEGNKKKDRRCINTLTCGLRKRGIGVLPGDAGTRRGPQGVALKPQAKTGGPDLVGPRD